MKQRVLRNDENLLVGVNSFENFALFCNKEKREKIMSMKVRKGKKKVSFVGLYVEFPKNVSLLLHYPFHPLQLPSCVNVCLEW